MKVARGRVVSIDYSVRLPDGDMVESSSGDWPLVYLHGRSQLVPGVEQAIDGHEEGTELEVELGPDEAYGPRDPDGVFLIPRRAFPNGDELTTGTTFSAVRPDGGTVLFRVLRATHDMVLVDTNHPLAGQTLRVWVAVRDVRDATGEELRDGRVHPEVTEKPLLC